MGAMLQPSLENTVYYNHIPNVKTKNYLLNHIDNNVTMKMGLHGCIPKKKIILL